MTKSSSEKGLTKQIVISMVLGILIGSVLNFFPLVGWAKAFFLEGVIEVGGRIFMASLKVLVVPMVFVSLVCGVGALEDIRKLGRIGARTFIIYTSTTAMAITLALLVGGLINPGEGLHIDKPTQFEVKSAPPLVDVFANIFPSNPVQAFASGEMLQIIVFSILVGFGIILSGSGGKRVLSLFNDFNDVVMNMIMLLIRFAPIGIFCLMIKVFSEQGIDAILPMAKYFFTVLGILILHGLLVYGSMLKFLAKLSPIHFFRDFKEVMLFAFSTASSNATLPVNLEVCEKKLGVHNSIASFTLPLGATINMDGTSIMQGVATIFVSQVYGISLGFNQYLMVVLTATLASIGTAGVPGVGLVMLTMVFNQVGLPVEGIGLIVGVDRLLDMARTTLNVTGDAITSCIVAKSENLLNQKEYDT